MIARLREGIVGLFHNLGLHRQARDEPAWVRRRLYRHLLTVVEEERRVTQLLDLRCQPRLCLVDEKRVAMLRPGDRNRLELDEQLREELQSRSVEEQQAWEQSQEETRRYEAEQADEGGARPRSEERQERQERQERR